MNHDPVSRTSILTPAERRLVERMVRTLSHKFQGRDRSRPYSWAVHWAAGSPDRLREIIGAHEAAKTKLPPGRAEKARISRGMIQAESRRACGTTLLTAAAALLIAAAPAGAASVASGVVSATGAEATCYAVLFLGNPQWYAVSALNNAGFSAMASDFAAARDTGKVVQYTVTGEQADCGFPEIRNPFLSR